MNGNLSAAGAVLIIESDMAGSTKRDQVGQCIRLPVSFQPEIAKRNDVNHRQLFGQLRAVYAATLTSVKFSYWNSIIYRTKRLIMRKGTGDYTRDWPEIAAAIKEAAEWKCVRCGHPHDPQSGHTLTVHHLSMQKDQNSWWNCPALCQVCHLVVQAKVIMERNWMFDHTPWFRPYAAAYYGVRAGLLPDTNNYFDSLLLVRPEFVETWLDYLLSLGKPQGIGV